jgi:hypothetical protein
MLDQAAAAVDGHLQFVPLPVVRLHSGLPGTAMRDDEPRPGTLLVLLDRRPTSHSYCPAEATSSPHHPVERP